MKKLLIITIGLLVFSNIPVGAYSLEGSYTNLEDQNVKFERFKGIPLFLEAFSTECSHCLDQHPELVRIYNEFKNTVSMLSLTVDADDDIAKLLEYNISYPTSWEMGRNLDSTLERFNIKYTPTMILFDSEGNYANCWIGFTEYSILNFEINSFLDDPVGYNSGNKDKSCNIENTENNYLNYGLIFSGVILIYFIISDIRKRRTIKT